MILSLLSDCLNQMLCDNIILICVTCYQATAAVAIFAYKLCVQSRVYHLETGTTAELRLALTITLTLTDTGFAVLTLLLGHTRRSPDPKTQEALS